MTGMVAAAGWLVMAATALELTFREVARQSLLPGWMGGDTSSITLVAVAAAAAVAVFALAPRPRPGLARATPLVFAVLFCAGVSAQLALGARLQSDGFYYFAYLRSLAFDRDVEFSNDYRLLGLGDKPHLFQPTRTGHAQSAWTIGPAILWSPFFAGGHVVARELNKSNPNVTPNGMSFPYRQAVCIAGLIYGLIGCWFMYRVSLRTSDVPIAAAATVLTVGGSFMLWYLVKEPSMTHAPSMAVVAGFVWAWIATRERRTTIQWALLGALAGFMTLVRWQNGIFALLPACDSAVALVRAWRGGDRAAGRGAVVNGLLFTGAAAIAFLPQMLAWRAIYGSWLAVSPVGPQVRFFDPHIVDILWSARNGLFSTAPALYAGAIGLLLFARVNPAVGLPALLAVAAMTYFNACIQDWWGSAGYGGRRFDGTLPLLAIGCAYLIAVAIDLVRRFPAAAVATAGLVLLFWNLTLMSAAQAGVVRIGETVSFGDTMAAQARVFHGWLGNPFTYPASLLYAMRNGVSPASYDVLYTDRMLGDPLRPYGRIDVGSSGDAALLRDGWHDPEREAAITFRWASERAEVLIPLDHASTLRTELRLHAFAFPNAPPQTVTMIVNGHALAPVPVGPGWHSVDATADASAWHAGVNRVTLQFAWARSPGEARLGNDPRQLAAAVDFVRVVKVK
jgi:hypothetical protein